MKTIVAAAGSFQSGVLSALFPLSSCALTRFTLGTLVANAIGHDGVISGFRVYLESNTYSASRTIFLRKNGVNTAISLVIPAGATGVFVSTDTLAYVATDTFAVAMSAPGGGGTSQISTVQFVLDNGDPDTFYQIIGCAGEQTVFSAYPSADTFYGSFAGESFPLNASGEGNVTVTEAQAAMRALGNGTLRNMQFYVSDPSSSLAGPMTIRSRINGAYGNLIITVNPGDVGIFQDTTHTDALTVGDTFCYEIDYPGSGGSGQIYNVSASIDSDDGFTLYAAGNRPIDVRPAGATPTYAALIGYHASTTTIRAQNVTFVPFPTVLSKFTLRIATNTYTEDCVYTIAKGTSDTLLTLTVPAGATGIFQISTGDIVVNAGDELTVKTTGGGTGDILPSWTAVAAFPRVTVGSPSLGSPGILGGADLSKVVRVNPVL